MTKASDNVYPKVLLGPLGAPAAPSDASWKLYPMADGVYARSSNTTVGPLGSGGGGSMATDAIWDAAGDLVQGTGANTAAKLTAGTAGQFLKSAGAAAANLWAFPPGYELDYVETTSTLTVTAVSEATAQAYVTGSAVAYDGSTVVQIECFLSYLYMSTAGHGLYSILYDGSSSIGVFGYHNIATGATDQYAGPLQFARRLTPSNASHTYSLRFYKDTGTTAQVAAGAGGTGANMPGYIRITKV